MPPDFNAVARRVMSDGVGMTGAEWIEHVSKSLREAYYQGRNAAKESSARMLAVRLPNPDAPPDTERLPATIELGSD